jgi:predicted adenylyl cyclase CyaB
MSPPARNIELKARLADVTAARAVAQRLATAYLGVENQRDTYFNCPRGRLKLREIQGKTSQLIAYERADKANAKQSDYRLIELADANTSCKLRELLAAVLGVTVVVQKTREIFLHRNVRIHLDVVAGLGSFIEFEAVVGGEIDDDAGRAQVAWLQQQFGIESGDLLARSYSDMLDRGGHVL